MSDKVSRLMAGESRAKSVIDAIATRKERRRAVKSMIQKLEGLISAEIAYRDNIPANLSGSSVYETAEQTIEYLEEALNSLDEAY